MRTIVITGASDGIGALAAESLSTGSPAAGATPSGDGLRVVLVGRSPAKTQAVAERLGLEYHLADFARLDDVRRLADELLASCRQIDVLANNAGGIFAGPTLTEDGFERTFQVNHLAPVLLTWLLRERLLASRGAVVNTSSVGARLWGHVRLDDLNGWRHFRPERAYCTSKLANILFTKGLHTQFHEQGLSSVAFHPGTLATNFASDTSSPIRFVYRTALRRTLVSPETGGDNLTHFISGTPGQTWVSGEYYDDRRRIGRTHRQAYDPVLVRRHWELSAEMLGIAW